MMMVDYADDDGSLIVRACRLQAVRLACDGLRALHVENLGLAALAVFDSELAAASCLMREVCSFLFCAPVVLLSLCCYAEYCTRSLRAAPHCLMGEHVPLIMWPCVAISQTKRKKCFCSYIRINLRMF